MEQVPLILEPDNERVLASQISSRKVTFQNGHIPKRALSKEGTFKKGYIQKRHIPKKDIFQKEHIAKRAHLKKGKKKK